MDLGIKNKVAFVSASSQGLGKSSAVALAKEGAHVAICGRNQELLRQTAGEIKALGVKVLSLEGDLSSAADCRRFVDATLAEFGSVDILVTNTGGPPTGKFESFEQADWDKAFQQLTLSVVALAKGFIPGMRDKKWGRIISITSQAVKQPVNNLVLSNAVRSSIVGLLKTLATELGEHQITVNNIMPGYTQTQRLAKLIETNPAVAKVTSEIPLGRFGKPEEFGAVVAFLASEQASYITGVSLAVDGGWIRGV
jgi:3-oxoacyl-[acyl-carrier protein] reductase